MLGVVLGYFGAPEVILLQVLGYFGAQRAGIGLGGVFPSLTLDFPRAAMADERWNQRGQRALLLHHLEVCPQQIHPGTWGRDEICISAGRVFLSQGGFSSPRDSVALGAFCAAGG